MNHAPTNRGTLGAVLLLAAMVAAPYLVSKSYLYSLTDIVILGLFAISYNLLFGYSGLLSFGHAAYFGVGAYGCALALQHFDGMPVMGAVAMGTLAAAAAGLVLGSICVQRGGPYFAMLTMAFGMLIYAVLWKWRSLTMGDDGFGTFVPDDMGMILVGGEGGIVQTYFGVLMICAPVLALVWLLMTFTPYGNAVRSIRLNEERAGFLGYNVFAIKLANYVLSTTLAGLAGCLYALFHDFVSPQLAGMEMSTDVVMMTFIGGTSAFFGPLIGSAFYVLFSDFLSALTERWQMIMGLVFVYVVMFVPNGFAGMIGQAAHRMSRLLSPSGARRPQAGKEKRSWT